MAEVTELSGYLLKQWKQGNHDSVTELFDRYEARLVGLVRARIASQFKSRIDSHAIVNSAFREFLKKVEIGVYVPQKSGSPWSYLAAIARNKVAKQIEHHSAQKRNATREVVPTDELMRSPKFIDREPNDEEAIALMDELEELMNPMTAMERLMLIQRLEGVSIEQVAKNIDHSEAFVRDFLKKTRHKLEAKLKSFL